MLCLDLKLFQALEMSEVEVAFITELVAQREELNVLEQNSVLGAHLEAYVIQVLMLLSERLQLLLTPLGWVFLDSIPLTDVVFDR